MSKPPGYFLGDFMTLITVLLIIILVLDFRILRILNGKEHGKMGIFKRRKDSYTYADEQNEKAVRDAQTYNALQDLLNNPSKIGDVSEQIADIIYARLVADRVDSNTKNSSGNNDRKD